MIVSSSGEALALGAVVWAKSTFSSAIIDKQQIPTVPRSIRRMCGLLALLQEPVHFLSEFPADPSRRRDLCRSCLPQGVHRSELSQQQIFAVLAYTGTIVKYAFLDAFL